MSWRSIACPPLPPAAGVGWGAGGFPACPVAAAGLPPRFSAGKRRRRAGIILPVAAAAGRALVQAAVAAAAVPCTRAKPPFARAGAVGAYYFL